MPFDLAINAGLGSAFAWGMKGNVKGTTLAFVISSIGQTILFITGKNALADKVAPSAIFKSVTVIVNTGMVLGLLHFDLVPPEAVFLYGAVSIFMFFAEFQKDNRKERG
jgi:hypothetical protein